MKTNVSRSRLASVVVDRLASLPRAQVLAELAVYLVEEGQGRHVDLILSEIEAEYARRGRVVADVTTARVLDDASRSELIACVAKAEEATDVELREHVESELIGGVIIETPGKYFDSSIKHQLNQLKTLSPSSGRI